MNKFMKVTEHVIEEHSVAKYSSRIVTTTKQLAKVFMKYADENYEVNPATIFLVILRYKEKEDGEWNYDYAYMEWNMANKTRFNSEYLTDFYKDKIVQYRAFYDLDELGISGVVRLRKRFKR